MNVLGIVPARAGSKRIPRKNLRSLAGKPLVLWALEAAMKAERLDRVVVSSDDPEVLDLAAARDPSMVIRRPAHLAADDSPPIDYVHHVLESIEGGGPRWDVIVIVQPSSPLTLPADIDGTVSMLDASGADTAVSVVKVAHDLHPTKFKRMEGARLVPYFEEEHGRMSAHELPEVYVRNCSVYATRRSIVSSGKIIGDVCLGYEMPRSRSIDINDELDLAFAEFLVQRESSC